MCQHLESSQFCFASCCLQIETKLRWCQPYWRQTTFFVSGSSFVAPYMGSTEDPDRKWKWIQCMDNSVCFGCCSQSPASWILSVGMLCCHNHSCFWNECKAPSSACLSNVQNSAKVITASKWSTSVHCLIWTICWRKRAWNWWSVSVQRTSDAPKIFIFYLPKKKTATNSKTCLCTFAVILLSSKIL